MQIYARIQNGIVVELFSIPAAASITEYFHADIAAQFVPVPTGQSPWQGWSYAGGAFSAPVVSPAQTLAAGAAVALSAGLAISSTGSLTLTGVVFPVDPVSTQKISAVITTINTTGGFPTGASAFPMKTSAGAWISMTVLQYKSVAGALADYAAQLILILDGNPLSATTLPNPAASLTLA